MFITYTHVDQLKAREKRWQVNSYQNRRRKQLKAALPSTGVSARASRPRVLQWGTTNSPRERSGAHKPVNARVLSDLAEGTADSEIVQSTAPVVEKTPLVSTTLRSLRRDPFNSYPLNNNTECVQWSIDFCKPQRASTPGRVCKICNRLC